MTTGLPTPPPQAPRGRGRVREGGAMPGGTRQEDSRLEQMATSARLRSTGTKRTVTLPGASVVNAGRGATRAVRRGATANARR